MSTHKFTETKSDNSHNSTGKMYVRAQNGNELITLINNIVYALHDNDCNRGSTALHAQCCGSEVSSSPLIMQEKWLSAILLFCHYHG